MYAITMIITKKYIRLNKYCSDSLKIYNHTYTCLFIFIFRRFEAIGKRSHDSLMQDDQYECCPTVTRRIAPLGGLSREGKLLQLYRDYRTVQRFYETSCKQNILNRPCNYIEPSLLPMSSCIQKYTYMYAIVRDYNVTQPYRVDYIRVKSGCSCRVEPTTPSSNEHSN